MSVGRRLMMSLTVLVLCTALLGAGAIGGLLALSGKYGAAEEQYAQLRALYEIGFRAAMARQLLGARERDAEAIRTQVRIAAREADGLAEGKSGKVGSDARIAAMRESIRARLAQIESRVQDVDDAPGLTADVNRWLAEVSALVTQTQSGIVENRRAAMAGLEWTIGGMLVALGVCVAVAIGVGVGQYRSVMRPLRGLRDGMARVSGGGPGARVAEQGDEEFRELVRAFNQMDGALERVHASLRNDVESMSRQLLRTEQLAGVGSLAAGLAHEINNPLGIIAGHAQTTLRRLDRAATDEERRAAVDRARETLGIICEEAFRCRDIALQLLRLAEPERGDPEAVRVNALVEKAVELVGHLPAARGREIVRDAAGGELVCRGHGAQVLQVVINLLTNALEACPAAGGRVEVSVEGRGTMVGIVVRDNGCGMDERTLARAFEPFFTDKPRRGLAGHGLGLAVSHAIVERHGGRLFAHSAGAGKGSVFSIELPVATSQAGDGAGAWNSRQAGEVAVGGAA